ncbi:MAG: serine O-acetyltransferase [Oscillospiraceae bacterium]
MGDRDRRENIDDLVSAIVTGYEISKRSALQPDFLPEKDAIIEIIGILRKILFPGYFDKVCVQEGDMKYYVGNLLTTVHQKLQQQICRALNHGAAETGGCENPVERSCELSFAFLSRIPEIREILLTDVQATMEGDPAACDEHEVIFAYPGIFAISIYRLAHELHLLSVPLIPRIMTEYAHSITGIDIHPGADIGHHFFIDHGTGVVIGETTEIGNYVKIYQGVTLGALSTRGGQSLRGFKRHPTLEDEVTVYSATSILGGESIIGKGAVIGSNAFITKSVPASTRVSIKSPELRFKDLKPQEPVKE